MVPPFCLLHFRHHFILSHPLALSLFLSASKLEAVAKVRSACGGIKAPGDVGKTRLHTLLSFLIIQTSIHTVSRWWVPRLPYLRTLQAGISNAHRSLTPPFDAVLTKKSNIKRDGSVCWQLQWLKSFWYIFSRFLPNCRFWCTSFKKCTCALKM